jgi:murein DD-endopeptidase MepM/ murein hydrolase activator NlpD
MKLVYPLQGKSLEVTSGHGMRWGRQHKGVDLAADSGTRVLSVLDGIVEKSGDFNDGYGGQVLIKHPTEKGNYYSRYTHLRKWYVRPGERVNAGERIGESGGDESDPHKGRSTGPHLHFEFLGEGLKPMDPEPFLKGAGLTAAAAGAMVSNDKKSESKYETKPEDENVVDKIMRGVAKVMTPIGIATAIKGASTPKKESINQKKLLEEISRIKHLLN